MRGRRRTASTAAPVVTALVATLGLGACSAGGTEPADVTGVPESWLEDTADGWADSDGYGQAMPHLGRGGCLLGDEPPEMLGVQGGYTDVGWGPYGDDPAAPDSYRYLCGLWSPDRYAGELQLIKVADAAAGSLLVDEFDAQTSTAVQENEVTTVTSGRLEVSVLRRWTPSNPQGAYRVLYLDEDALAAVVLEINSLDESDFAAFSDQDAADALVAAMAAAG